ncbi:carboxylesterase [Planoprotostelium fungivorum]|uniref:Carboxylesterase n=1 Tax=Planoprotostelium fungivorum TaxID=1890364 RepID=A0A2P6N9Y4_9EUKA|nr:carboxylesterase [Planoprotostelium fungivorum]
MQRAIHLQRTLLAPRLMSRTPMGRPHSSLQYPIILSPPAPRKIMGSIIWIHGDNMPPQNFAELWFLSFKPKYFRMIIPRGIFQEKSLPEKPIWYSSDAASHQITDGKQLKQSVEYIHNLIEEEKRFTSTKDIILAGYEQGGALATLAGITYPEVLSGMLCCNGYAPSRKGFEREIEESANRETQILCIHGQRDDKIPFSLANESFENLKESGFKGVEVFASEGGHEIDEYQQKTIGIFFGNYDNTSMPRQPQKTTTEEEDDARLAQSVERTALNRVVGGSSPPLIWFFWLVAIHLDH